MIALMPASDLAAFVLAGGQSSRMGTDKAFVLLDGQSLLSRSLDLAHSVTDHVHIVGAREKYSAFAPTVEDVFAGCGPLAGIHSALRASPKDLNLIIAVDIPFVSAPLLEYLVARSRDSAALVTVPRVGRGFQPLCALYRRAFAEAAEQSLRAGQYKIDALFEPAQTQIVSEEELRSAGFAPQLFRNLNAPEDLENARK